MQDANPEMNGFYQDILGQPAVLCSLLRLYNPATGKALPAIPAPATPSLTCGDGLILPRCPGSLHLPAQPWHPVLSHGKDQPPHLLWWNPNLIAAVK